MSDFSYSCSYPLSCYLSYGKRDENSLRNEPAVILLKVLRKKRAAYDLGRGLKASFKSGLANLRLGEKRGCINIDEEQETSPLNTLHVCDRWK